MDHSVIEDCQLTGSHGELAGSTLDQIAEAPDSFESIDDALAYLHAGKIGGFNILSGDGRPYCQIRTFQSHDDPVQRIYSAHGVYFRNGQFVTGSGAYGKAQGDPVFKRFIDLTYGRAVMKKGSRIDQLLIGMGNPPSPEMYTGQIVPA